MHELLAVYVDETSDDSGASAGSAMKNPPPIQETRVCPSVGKIPEDSALSLVSRVQLFTTPWTVGLPAPLSTGLPRQEHWSG